MKYIILSHYTNSNSREWASTVAQSKKEATEIVKRHNLYRLVSRAVSINQFFKNCDTLEEKLQRLLEKALCTSDDYEVVDNKYISISINWGDWKHDHLYIDQLMQGVFGLTCIKEEVTDEDGSDCYSATHYYEIV